MTDARVPDPALIVLVGAAGSGKTHWASERYRAVEVVSSDALRDVVGSGPADLDASADAFSLLDVIVSARAGRRLTTVVDTLGLDPVRRLAYLDIARKSGLPAVAFLLETSPELCRRRNAERDRPVPAKVLTEQLRKMRQIPDDVAAEGWDLVLRIDQPEERGQAPTIAGPAEPASPDRELGVVLQVSQFPWGKDPVGWLTAITDAAVEAGFEGIALMDHLLQIPQVGRAWDPLPDPYVTLGMLAGRTSDLTLGTLVTPVSFRAPGLVAKAVATLDTLSGGRAFCGIGAGWFEREHHAFGLPFPSASERVDRLQTAVETLRALWAPGTKPFVGQHVQLPETTCYPRPVHDVPIIVGGAGRRTLRVAAALGDACNVRSDPDLLDRAIPLLRQHCIDLGRDPAEVAITVLDVPVIGTDRDDVAARVERLRGRTAAASYAKQHHAGTVDDQLERYRGLAARGVSTAFLALPDLASADDVARCAPLVQAMRV